MNDLSEAALVASLLAVDPQGVGGVWLRSQPLPVRDQWLRILRELLPAAAPMRRIPSNIGANRLLGGLDLAATLRAKRPIAEHGVLSEAHGGVLVVAMSERLSAYTAACLNSVIDAGEVVLSREGVLLRHEARFGVVALDEGVTDDECAPHSLCDRLGLLLDLNALNRRAQLSKVHEPSEILAARCLLPTVRVNAAIAEALCATALALGAGSPRIGVLGLRVAKAAAALDGREWVDADDAAIAGKFVLAPRATRLPPPTPDAAPAEPDTPPAEPDTPPAERETSPDASSPDSGAELASSVLAAARAAIPKGLLAAIVAADRIRSQSGGIGRAGSLRNAANRGRPAGVRSGSPRGGARLNVIETLRAAAPWQRLRGREAGDSRVRVTPADFRVTRYKQRSCTLTIFAVDASGSSALNRLAEAKGAVELLLADCYIRRDLVAVIAFRGRTAEMLLPPTRSLVRAKRSLAGLPGGGGTPLAAAINASVALAMQSERRAETPTLVVLSDGRANVALDGTPGREVAHREALGAAKGARRAGIAALFVDTSPRPNALANELALAMNARYLPLPYVSAQALSAAVKQTVRP